MKEQIEQVVGAHVLELQYVQGAATRTPAGIARSWMTAAPSS